MRRSPKVAEVLPVLYLRGLSTGDFRYALVQVRDNAHAVAEAGGEPAERARLGGRLGAVVDNFRHILANSLIAVLNVTGVQVGVLIGGLVLTEEIFILPGIGRLLLESIQKRDFPVITGATLFLASAFVAVNLAVDLIHGLLDPRLRR